MRCKLGVLHLDDVAQTIKVDVNTFFFFKPVENIEHVGTQHVRFENIERPNWIPSFDFADEIEEVLCTDESYWLE